MPCGGRSDQPVRTCWRTTGAGASRPTLSRRMAASERRRVSLSTRGRASIPSVRRGRTGTRSISIQPTCLRSPADLGIDKVLAYRLNHGDGSLTPAESPYTPHSAGRRAPPLRLPSERQVRLSPQRDGIERSPRCTTTACVGCSTRPRR